MGYNEAEVEKAMELVAKVAKIAEQRDKAEADRDRLRKERDAAQKRFETISELSVSRGVELDKIGDKLELTMQNLHGAEEVLHAIRKALWGRNKKGANMVEAVKNLMAENKSIQQQLDEAREDAGRYETAADYLSKEK